MIWLGCTECGDVTPFAAGRMTCGCDAWVRVLDGAAEKREFKLTMAERADEAAAVRKAAP